MNRSDGRISFAILFCFAFLGALPAAANPFDLYGLGSRGPAMAGACTALADDFSATYYNPAGLARCGNFEFTAGLTMAEPRLTVNAVDREIDGAFGFTVGAALPVPFGGPLEEKLVFGLVIYNSLVKVNFVRIYFPDPAEPHFVMYENRTERFVALTTLSYRIHESVSIGGGVQLFPFDSPNSIDRISGDSTGTTTISTDLQLLTKYAPHLGLLLEPGAFADRLDGFLIGVAYRGEMFQNFSLPSNIDLGLPLHLDIAGIDHYSPQQVALGIAYESESGIKLAFDLGWFQWSRMPSPLLETKVTGIHDILPGLQDMIFIPPDPGFHDTLVPRIGLEYSIPTSWASPLSIRAGYGYFASPVPVQKEETNLLDCDKHLVTMGTGARVTRFFSRHIKHPVIVDFHIQVHALEPRAAKRGTGLSTSTEAAGTIISGGITLTLEI